MTGLACPTCGNQSIECIDSRKQPDHRRRRYACTGCEDRFSTIEVVLPDSGSIIVERAPGRGANGVFKVLTVDQWLEAKSKRITRAIERILQNKR